MPPFLLLPLAALLFMSHVYTSSLPPSPCPEMYGYEKNEFGELRGLIAIMTPPRYSEVRVTVTLSSAVPVAQHEVGDLIVKGGMRGAEEATKQVLLGRRHMLQYHITFPPGKPVPYLVSIAVNGRDFCVARHTPPNSRAQITLHSFLSTGVSAPPTNDFGPVTGLFPSNAQQPEPEVSESSLPALNGVEEAPDEYYLSKLIIKLLHLLLEVQMQRLTVEREILSLEKQKHGIPWHQVPNPPIDI